MLASTLRTAIRNAAVAHRALPSASMLARRHQASTNAPVRDVPLPDDQYPSRFLPEPNVIERKYPVVWGSRKGPLSSEEVEQFDKKGFLVMRNLLKEREVEALRKECNRLKQQHESEARQSGGRVTTSFKAATEPNTDVLRSVFEVHKWNEHCNHLARDGRILERVQQILDDDVYVHQSRINFQPSFSGTGFNWHSDFETWHVEDGMPLPRAMSAVVLLSDNHPQNGALMVIPGSHKHYVCCVGKTPAANWERSLREQQQFGTPDRGSLARMADEGGIVHCAAPAGSVVMFDCNLMHGSHNNITPWGRMNAFFVYNSLSNRCRNSPYNAPSLRPEHISTHDPAWVHKFEVERRPVYSRAQ